jgi:hypothetical protein
MTKKITTPGDARQRQTPRADKPKAGAVASAVPVEPTAPVFKNSTMRQLGGSNDDRFNMLLFEQTLKSIPGCAKLNSDSAPDHVIGMAFTAQCSVKPTDESEGMIAAQMFATHNATMDSYRRAGLPGQPHEKRMGLMNAASKCSRTFVTLLEGLNRSRGKGNYTVRAEHATVLPRATAAANGGHTRSRDEANADRLGDAP